MAADACIAIHGLTFTYAGETRPALRDVTLEVRRGELLGIAGANGSGKTTLALTINGVVPRMLGGQRDGLVRVEGRDPAATAVGEMAALVGMVFDAPELQLSQATVADEVALGLESLGVAWAEMDERVRSALAAVGLAGLEDRAPASLSGGEQQRLAIACVVAQRPAILVLDEPLANLDATGRAAVLDIVRRLHREEQVTVVLIEHDAEVLAEHADRVVVLDDGTVARDGPPAAVLGDVRALRRLGVAAPPIAELVAELDPGEPAPPVTLDGALTWLAARR